MGLGGLLGAAALEKQAVADRATAEARTPEPAPLADRRLG
jgi:hypothetical protein